MKIAVHYRHASQPPERLPTGTLTACAKEFVCAVKGLSLLCIFRAISQNSVRLFLIAECSFDDCVGVMILYFTYLRTYLCVSRATSR